MRTKTLKQVVKTAKVSGPTLAGAVVKQARDGLKHVWRKPSK
jgi:hypothetical protein